MKYLLLLVILIYCIMTQGILEWTVVGKVTEYGQNVTLFCNVPHCCPEDSGWDRWTPVQQTLFIDIKTGQSNKKYDGKVLKDGYTLVIQNLTKNDLNVSYSCLYGVTLGERKFLLEEDVFNPISPTQPNVPNGQLSPSEISALIIGVIVLVLGSLTLSIYFWRRRSKSKGKSSNSVIEVNSLDIETDQKELENNSDLKEKIINIETEQEQCILKNIRDLIHIQIKDWKKKDEMFVSTKASDYVMECLQENSCVTLTAPSGAGKSFISRHAALILHKDGYRIIPVYSPTDIRDYYKAGKPTVFIVDDICGNFIAKQSQIENWKQLLPVIYTVIADNFCKIIVSCRLQVYKDDKFNILVPFKSCECNLTSNNLCLTSVEKKNIAKQYIGTSINEIDVETHNSDFFPLLCSLYHDEKLVDVNEFFNNPFDVYKNELDKLSEHGDEGNYKICGLALCVLFNNQLVEKWFEGKVTDEQRQIIEDTCNACDINRSTSKAKLKKALDTLDGTFIFRQNRIYKTVHDKVFDFLAHYFGQKMIECLIEHGDSDLVHERFIWQKSTNDKKCNIDFIIEIPDDHLESYLQRLTEDWSEGKVTVVFNNTNLKVSSFRQKLLEKLEQLKKPKKVSLVNTKDKVVPKTDCGSGNTPLILTCYYGYTDMVQWVLHNDVDVDQCRDDRVSGLYMASQNGHTDIVKLLLERNPDVNLCNKTGCSPLIIAIYKGHTDIVMLLLERNPDVNLCNKNDCSPLIIASYNGHTDIVRLLLERKPDPCNNNTSISNSPSLVQPLLKHKPDINAQACDGGNALYFSARDGNIEITQLLLENNANCNICIHNKQSMTDIFNNDTDFELNNSKQNVFDNLVDNTSSRVTEYVSKKSVDYAFDLVAGSSSLHIACFMGRINIVRCIIDHKGNINMTKEDGTTPLFYACEVGYEDIVRLLLDNGADTQICRMDKKFPLDIATQNGHTSIVMILTKHMKKRKQCTLQF